MASTAPFAKMNGIGNEIIVADMRGRVDRVTPAAAIALNADAATSFDTWAHLRSHRGLSATRSAAVVKRTVLTLLADALGD